MTEDEIERYADKVFPLARQVAEALEGAVYPLTRQQLLWVARENDTPKSVLTLISALPDRPYRSMDEVEEAVDRPQVTVVGGQITEGATITLRKKN